MEADDDAGAIGRGSHGRFVIDRERFDGSMGRKRKGEAARKAGADKCP